MCSFPCRRSRSEFWPSGRHRSRHPRGSGGWRSRNAGYSFSPFQSRGEWRRNYRYRWTGIAPVPTSYQYKRFHTALINEQLSRQTNSLLLVLHIGVQRTVFSGQDWVTHPRYAPLFINLIIGCYTVEMFCKISADSLFVIGLEDGQTAGLSMIIALIRLNNSETASRVCSGASRISKWSIRIVDRSIPSTGIESGQIIHGKGRGGEPPRFGCGREPWRCRGSPNPPSSARSSN